MKAVLLLMSLLLVVIILLVQMDYTITRGTSRRIGQWPVVNEDVTGNTTFDGNLQNSGNGVTLTWVTAAGVCSLQYSSTAGDDATLIYSITNLL